jgi:hypothetical protein
MIYSDPPEQTGVSGRQLLGGAAAGASGWGGYAGPSSENDGNWCCQVSINSDELQKLASPFDDIGYLPTNIEHGKSFKMKDGCGNRDNSNSTSKPKKTSSLSNSSSLHSHGSKGPSLNEFFTSEKPSVSIANDAQNNVPQASAEGGAKAPMRGKRGQLQRAASRRGDIGNYNVDNDDDQSIGASTIASRFTIRSKAAMSIFDISKTSLTLSMLGGGNKSSRNDSRSFGKSGSKHSSTADPSFSKHSVSISKTNRTMTTNTTMTTLTKSASGGSFASSMFSRDPSKSKEKMREAIEHLQAANRSLINDKQILVSRVDELTDALEKASFLHDWFSVMELAEANTQVCKFKSMYERAEIERERLDEFVRPLERQVHKLIAENEEKNDRIAYLEARLIENQLSYLSQHDDTVGEGSHTTLESADSFASFGCDDCYEEDLKAADGESAVYSEDDERMLERPSETEDTSSEGSMPPTNNNLDREGLSDALNRLEKWEKCDDRLATLDEMAEDLNSSTSVFTRKSNESSEHRHKKMQKHSWLTLGSNISDASTQQAGNITNKDSGLALGRRHSDDSPLKPVKQSSWMTVGAEGFKAPRKEVHNKTGMALDDYMNDATKPSVSAEEAMETGTWAMCDEIISVLPESKHDRSKTVLPPPTQPTKDRKGRSKSPKKSRSPARRKKNNDKAVAEANNGEDIGPETQASEFGVLVQ